MIGSPQGAIEYIVGRHMEERNFGGRGHDRKIARSQRVDGVRFVHATLGVVNQVERRGVNHEVWLMLRNRLAHLLEARDIESGMLQSNQVVTRQRAHQAAPELAARAGDENLHFRDPGSTGKRSTSSSMRSAARSASDSSGRSTGHLMPIAGSFQAMRSSSRGS